MSDKGVEKRNIYGILGNSSVPKKCKDRIMGAVIETHQGEEGAEERDGSKVSDVSMHVIVLLHSEQRVVTLDAAALHILVPTRLNVGLHQGGFALP